MSAIPTARGEKRRRALLKAARQIVREGGFRDLQMNAVAAVAGVAVGTIYRYFPSKAELCAELVATVSQRELDVMTEIAAADGQASERLRDAVQSFARRAYRSGRLAYAMIAEPVDPEVEDVRLSYRAAIGNVYKRLIEEGIADGSLQASDPDTASACLTGAFMEGTVGPLTPGHEADPAEIEAAVAQIGAFCVNGVSPSARRRDSATNSHADSMNEDRQGGAGHGQRKHSS